MPRLLTRAASTMRHSLMLVASRDARPVWRRVVLRRISEFGGHIGNDDPAICGLYDGFDESLTVITVMT